MEIHLKNDSFLDCHQQLQSKIHTEYAHEFVTILRNFQHVEIYTMIVSSKYMWST